ncbi:MAG TPA: flagellar biosynthetic protein FliO [Phycisphaerae bacterium]|nr:flagellar biosynthetic protein FliO [Phycisphaerae bacterium]
MMTHSRHPSSFVAVALACCCGALPCRAAALEYPSSQAVANASLSTETVVAPPPPATTQVSVAEPVEQSRVWGNETQQRGGELAAARPWYLSPVSALAVVVVLILVAAWVAKRLLPGMRRDGKRGPLQVLATTYLSPKQSLALVRCGRRMILIGVTPEHISSLAVMDDTNDLPSLARVSDRSDGQRLSGQFNEVLDEAAKDFDRNDAAWDEPLGPDERELAAARQEIRGLLDRVRSFAGNRL